MFATNDVAARTARAVARREKVTGAAWWQKFGHGEASEDGAHVNYQSSHAP